MNKGTLRSNSGHIGVFVMIMFGIVFAVVSVAQADIRTWTPTDGSNWNNDDNWDTLKPVNDDSVVFGTTGAGAVNTMDIADLSLDTFTVDKAEHTTDLDGRTLAVGSLLVGGGGAMATVTGKLDIANGTLQVNALFHAMGPKNSHVYVNFSNDAMLKVGVNANNRGQLLLGDDSGSLSTNQIVVITVGELFGDA